MRSPAHHAEHRSASGEPECIASGAAIYPGVKTDGVHATRQRHHALRGQEARGHILAVDRVGHRRDKVGGFSVEPPVPRMRSDRLDDVTGPYERARRAGNLVGQRS